MAKLDKLIEEITEAKKKARVIEEAATSALEFRETSGGPDEDGFYDKESEASFDSDGDLSVEILYREHIPAFITWLQDMTGGPNQQSSAEESN